LISPQVLAQQANNVTPLHSATPVEPVPFSVDKYATGCQFTFGRSYLTIHSHWSFAIYHSSFVMGQ
jgi:hypothetical protein